MYISFILRPTINYKNNKNLKDYDEDHKLTKDINKINKKLLDQMIKDILSKSFRDWYSKTLNKNAKEDLDCIDNYLDFNITKITKKGPFEFLVKANLIMIYEGKEKTDKDKNYIDNLLTVKNIREYLRTSSWWHYIHANTYAGEVRGHIKTKKYNKEGYYGPHYVLQNNKLVKEIDINLESETADFTIMSYYYHDERKKKRDQDISSVKLYK